MDGATPLPDAIPSVNVVPSLMQLVVGQPGAAKRGRVFK